MIAVPLFPSQRFLWLKSVALLSERKIQQEAQKGSERSTVPTCANPEPIEDTPSSGAVGIASSARALAKLGSTADPGKHNIAQLCFRSFHRKASLSVAQAKLREI